MVPFDSSRAPLTLMSDANAPGDLATPVERDLLGRTKTAKRFSPHPWPFYVKSSTDVRAADAVHPSRANISSFN